MAFKVITLWEETFHIITIIEQVFIVIVQESTMKLYEILFVAPAATNKEKKQQIVIWT